MAKFQKLVRKIIFSIPHLSPAFEKRRHIRYKPTAKLSAAMTIGGETIICKVLDIGMGGLKIDTADGRVVNARNILLETGDFSLDIPCAKIKGHGPVYGVIFAHPDETQISGLTHIIENFTTQPFETAADEIMFR